MRKTRTKTCGRCASEHPNDVKVMYRVKTADTSSWIIVCPTCQKHLAEKVGYTYGGTWKATKRR